MKIHLIRKTTLIFIILFFILILLYFLFFESIYEVPLSDKGLLYSISILNLLSITLLFKKGNILFWISLLFFILINFYLNYGLIYRGEYGGSLVWLLSGLIINLFQFIINMGYLVIKFIKK